jgi:hypothetical protein
VIRLRFAACHQRDIAPLFTIWLLLALGLGTAALLYTALERLLLHPLSVSHPETLVRAGENHPPVVYWTSFPYGTYQAMSGMQTLDSVAAEATLDTVLTQRGSSIPVVAQIVSGNYFSVLGVTAEQGRTLAPSDDRPGDGEIPVVLSHRFFQQQFGISAFRPSQSLHLQGVPFSIVGVMPDRFYGTSLDSSPDLWLPTSAQSLLSNKALTDPEPDIFFPSLLDFAAAQRWPKPKLNLATSFMLCRSNQAKMILNVQEFSLQSSKARFNSGKSSVMH